VHACKIHQCVLPPCSSVESSERWPNTRVDVDVQFELDKSGNLPENKCCYKRTACPDLSRHLGGCDVGLRRSNGIEPAVNGEQLYRTTMSCGCGCVDVDCVKSPTCHSRHVRDNTTQQLGSFDVRRTLPTQQQISFLLYKSRSPQGTEPVTDIHPDIFNKEPFTVD